MMRRTIPLTHTHYSRTSTPLAEDKKTRRTRQWSCRTLGTIISVGLHFLLNKLRCSYAVAPSASVIFVFLELEARILKDLRDVLQMGNSHLLRMSQQRRERDQGYRKVELRQESVRRRSGCAWTS